MQLEELLESIDSLKIYRKDYDTIKTLMDNLPSKLFVKILEEVFCGNLFWEDFESYLSTNQEAKNYIVDNIENQRELMKRISNIADFRESLVSEMDLDNIGLIEEKWNQEDQELLDATKKIPDDDKTDADKEIIEKLEKKKLLADRFSEEKKVLDDDFIYSLIKPNSNDTPVQREFKVRLYNAIENGRVLKKDSKYGDYISGDGNLEYDGKTYQYLNIDNIILSADDFIISTNFDDIVLSDSDITFAANNDLTIDTMKKLKVVGMAFRNKAFLISQKDGTNE